MIRYALVSTTDSRNVSAYLPENYRVLGRVAHDGRDGLVIAGRDSAGWTLDDYVIPRLASGLYFAHEIDLSHPAMKQISEEK